MDSWPGFDSGLDLKKAKIGFAKMELSGTGDKSDVSSSDYEDTSGIFPAYALYRYQPNRPKECVSDKCFKVEQTVHDFLQMEARIDDNFSLSIVATSLNAEHETDLRELIASKLSKGTVYSGRGNITTIKFKIPGTDGSTASSLCYFCLLRDESAKSNSAKQDEKDRPYCSNEFVVCFLTAAEVTLDLFKWELDQYSLELMELLDSDPLLAFEMTDSNQVVELESVVKPFLQKWPEDVLHYVERCVTRLKGDLQYLIYAALLDVNVNFVTEDKQLKRDLKRFIECASLSELLSQLKSDVRSPVMTPSDNSLIGLDEPLEAVLPKSPSSKATLNVTLLTDSHSFDSTDCTPFCETWAQNLLNGEPTKTVFLKQIIDNFKLKAIQDMNTLKRLIRQAETDYYALYRAYVFLLKSGNAQILLKHAKTEHCALTSPDAQKVVGILEEFVQAKGNVFPSR